MARYPNPAHPYAALAAIDSPRRTLRSNPTPKANLPDVERVSDWPIIVTDRRNGVIARPETCCVPEPFILA
jgi:hypothetical protein